MYLLLSAENRYRDLAPDGALDGVTPPPKTILGHDPHASKLVAVEGTRTYHYDIASERWSLVVDEPEGSDRVPIGHFGHSIFGYDPESRAFLLYWGRTPDSVWIYETAARRWTRQAVAGPEAPSGGKRIGYFDPARNVLVVNERREVWVYRHGVE